MSERQGAMKGPEGSGSRLSSRRSSRRVGPILALIIPLLAAPHGRTHAGADAEVPATGAPAAASTSAKPAAALQSAPLTFTPLDLPDWVIIHAPPAPKDQPWILVVDDPQCPYCMQLLLALDKLREGGDSEISRAVLTTLPYPLPYHDQSAHIVADAFCLEKQAAKRPWSAASYLDWLILAPWKEESGWKSATIDDIEKDGGFFDSKYDAHRVSSSRRREFQTGFAKSEASCLPGGCRSDPECEKLCEEEKTCRAGCPAAQESTGAPPAAGSAGAEATASAPGGAREKCLADCVSAFVSRRYRQDSRVHSACLLEEGAGSAHAAVAAAFAWAVAHKVPGTPTVYAGHPSIGFRTLGDSDRLSDFLTLLRRALAEARQRLKPAVSGNGTVVH